MRLGRRWPRSFYARPVLEVARELVGSVLVRQLEDGSVLAGRLVEVEAYLGDGSDPSAHSHAGPTKRNRSMFGPPGRLYAYRIYGLHTCVNVVCDPPGVGSAVLLRAVEPLLGTEQMRLHRGLDLVARSDLIASGPGRLAQAFGFELADDGRSLMTAELSIRAPTPGQPTPMVGTGPRVGISKAVEQPYRFFARDDPWVSAWRPPKKKKSQRT